MCVGVCVGGRSILAILSASFAARGGSSLPSCRRNRQPCLARNTSTSHSAAQFNRGRLHAENTQIEGRSLEHSRGHLHFQRLSRQPTLLPASQEEGNLLCLLCWWVSMVLLHLWRSCSFSCFGKRCFSLSDCTLPLPLAEEFSSVWNESGKLYLI